MSAVRVGLIGYGLAGRAFHAPLIGATPGMELAAIATSQAESVARDWPGARVTDPEALLAAPDLDLVVIASPNDSHPPLARAAIAAGKHVVIDKPFVLDRAEGAALIGAARAAGRVLSVFHNRRWDGDFLTVRRVLGDGALGTVRLYEAYWDRFRPAVRPGWREEPGAGGGVLADLGPHLIDQALLLFGMPEAIDADIAVQRPEALVDDYFALTLHYDAMRAVLSCSTLIAAARPRFAVHGDGGSLVKYGLDPQEAGLRAGGRPDAPGFGDDAPDLYATLTDAAGQTRRMPTERGAYRRYYEGIRDAIRDGAPPPVDPADALAGLRLIALARQSAADGRRIAVQGET